MTVAVEAKNIGARYGVFTALRDVSFQLPQGALMAIVGPNGAGKSTLIKVLAGLLEPNQGAASVFESSMKDRDPFLVSYVPQIKTIERRFPALAIEMVASGLHGRWPWRLNSADRQKSLAALEKTGMTSIAEKPINELSGGQLQRVFLARGLVREPKLILLDEPAAGIDAPGEAELYRVLQQYIDNSGGTVVMVTHDWAVARHHASHVLFLNQTVIAFGPPCEVMNDDNLRKAFGHGGHAHPMLSVDPHPHREGGCDHHHA